MVGEGKISSCISWLGYSVTHSYTPPIYPSPIEVPWPLCQKVLFMSVLRTNSVVHPYWHSAVSGKRLEGKSNGARKNYPQWRRTRLGNTYTRRKYKLSSQGLRGCVLDSWESWLMSLWGYSQLDLKYAVDWEMFLETGWDQASLLSSKGARRKVWRATGLRASLQSLERSQRKSS